MNDIKCHVKALGCPKTSCLQPEIVAVLSHDLQGKLFFMLCPCVKYSITDGFHEAGFVQMKFYLAYFLKEILISCLFLFFCPGGSFFSVKNPHLIDNNRALQCLSPNLHTLFSSFYFSLAQSPLSPHISASYLIQR